MAGYTPLKIAGNTTGLVKYREEFLLPDDAYPILENAFVWRERIKRKQGYELLGRLQRNFTGVSIGNTGASPWSFNLFSTVSPAITEPNAEIVPGSVQIFFASTTVTGMIVAGPFAPGIQGYTNASNCEVFSNTLAGLYTGADVTITGVNIKPNTGTNSINDTWQKIEIIPLNTSFKLNVDSHTWGTWASGGTWSADSGSTNVFVDNGLGVLVAQNNPGSNFGTVNYVTGAITITHTAGAGVAASASFSYNPGIPVMGLRTRDLSQINNSQMVAFDQTYAYIFNGAEFEEFLPGTTWTGTDSQFFWSTNYFVGTGNLKIFWVTNFNDPIRYTNGVPGTNWVNFTPIINVAGGMLLNALTMLPFRSRLMAFNTIESDGVHPQRIRWAAIGTPFATVSPIVNVASANAWRDDIRGKGGFLDIPTSEDIITVGYVRDNLVIYCEHSTWQLRYTGRSIAPFQIERVNSELGVESTFSAIQFDTSLVGIGDKGVVECDSYQSERIDIKIVDLVIDDINNINQGPQRVHGIRDFQQRLAFWTYPTLDPTTGFTPTYPNRRLVYNYENDSWAIFTDSLTCLGTYQDLSSRAWDDLPSPAWQDCNFPWISRAALFPSVMGGNQQGFVLFLDEQTTNQESLFIYNIVGFGTTPASAPLQITSPNHNLVNGQIISIIGIPAGTPFATLLNGGIYEVFMLDANTINLLSFNPQDDIQDFTLPVQGPSAQTYIGGGLIRIRDNFVIQSKKFNFMDQGQTIQIGWIDVLFDATSNQSTTALDPSISLNVLTDYNEFSSNQTPENSNDDTFFNQIIETSSATGHDGGGKNWKRVICPTNANFVTIQWTLNSSQMNGISQESDVQIDAQILWQRPGGRMRITQ